MNSNIFQESAATKASAEEEADWSQFEDIFLEHSSAALPDGLPIVPPQLHPAVSLGMQKASSSYFSIGSNGSMTDLMSKLDDTNKSCADEFDMDTTNTIEWDNRSLQFDKDSSDLPYHDILMNVFTFLDAQSLTAFSETARRTNFEVFYFLQLQLQRALLVDDSYSSENDIMEASLHHDHLTAIAGSAFLSRLTRLDPQKAQATVNEYLKSNSTLRTMPLSHSIAYMRHFLNRRGFHNQFTEHNPSPSQALASAALLATVVGAAYMSGEMPAPPSFGTELPNMLFRFGFVGSLMGAARQMSDGESSKGGENKNKNNRHNQFRFPSLFEMKENLTATLRNNNKSIQSRTVLKPMFSDPYDHHHHHHYDDGEEKVELSDDGQDDKEEFKMPSGCVGAYSLAISTATNSIANLIKEGRKNRFSALTEEEQRHIVTTFLDSCSSDDGLPLVEHLIHTMDVDGFHLASDGSETCALHTAAFHGAAKVLDFLLQGIDDSNASKDGGLCQVNCKDSNGWTALHFAAGSNSVSAVQALARHGADLSMEANNGYSPMQWAKRLSNEQVEEALKELIHNESDRTMGWMSSQPLTTIANRFFSLIPSH
jgi:hypothetical protein